MQCVWGIMYFKYVYGVLGRDYSRDGLTDSVLSYLTFKHYLFYWKKSISSNAYSYFLPGSEHTLGPDAVSYSWDIPVNQNHNDYVPRAGLRTPRALGLHLPHTFSKNQPFRPNQKGWFENALGLHLCNQKYGYECSRNGLLTSWVYFASTWRRFHHRRVYVQLCADIHIPFQFFLEEHQLCNCWLKGRKYDKKNCMSVVWEAHCGYTLTHTSDYM